MEQAVSGRFDRNRFETLAGPQENTYSAFMSWTQVDAQVAPGHHIVFSASADPQKTDRANVNAFTAEDSAPRYERGGWSTALTERWTPGPHSTIEFTMDRVRSHQSVAPLGSGVYQMAPHGLSGNYFDSQDLSGARSEAAAVWGWSGGSHFLKLGASIGRVSLEGAENPGQVEMFGSDGSMTQRVTFMPANAGGMAVAAVDGGAFVQDRWAVTSRLTIDAGVRYDKTGGVAGAFAPRLAWTLALSSDGATTMSGSVGRYADKIPLVALAFERTASRRVESFGAVGAVTSDVRYRSRAAERLETPEAFRWDVEVDRRFSSAWQTRVKYQERHGAREFVVTPSIASASAGWLTLSATGQSTARSLEGTVAWRSLRAGHEAYVSYVRSSSEGNLNTLDSVMAALRDPLVRPDALAPRRADTPHRLLAWGMVRLPARVTVAPFFEARSGFPWTPLTDAWGYAEAPNAERLPWFGSVDLYVNKVFTVSDRLPDVRLGLKLYNIVSVHTERDVQRFVSRPDFGTAYNPIPRDFTLVFEVLWGHR
jgi:hypothetical protein